MPQLTCSETGVADELTIDFTYERNVNIGGISPSLHLAPFADERGLADPNTIVGDDRAQLPLADLIRDAFEQGFNKGGVEFVDEGADMEIVGTLLSSELETVTGQEFPTYSSPFALALSFAAVAAASGRPRCSGAGAFRWRKALAARSMPHLSDWCASFCETTISCSSWNNIGNFSCGSRA